MDNAKFFACRDAVLETLKAHGVEDMAEAAKVLASAINERVVVGGNQASVILRPLVAYSEYENKI